MTKQQRREQLERRSTVGICAILAILAIIICLSVTNAQAKEPVYEWDKYFTVVTIQPGDSLTGYAHLYGNAHVSIKKYIDEVCFINSMSDPDILVSGESLVVPVYIRKYPQGGDR